MSLTRELQPTLLREAFARFPSGVAALCATVDNAPRGIVASSFTVGVSLEPALVSFAVQNSSSTWPIVKRSRRIGVSILGSEHHDACRQIASKSGDRFAGLDLTEGEGGALLVDHSALWLETSVFAEVPAGDHHVVLLQVHGVATHQGVYEPLVFQDSTFKGLRAPEYVI